MLSTDTIAESLLQLHLQQVEKIEVFWIEVTSSRQQLIQDLTERLGRHPIMVAQVARDRFQDPNGVCDDLNLTIQENQHWCTQEARELVAAHQRFSLVLVSKRPLTIPQLSSPVALPDWFPQWPGEILIANVQSVFPKITLSLASPDIPQDAINSALFELEQAICHRLQAVVQLTPNAADALMREIGTGKAPTTVANLIASSERDRQSRSGIEFRPGGSVESGFIVSHLARVWRDCTPKNRYDLSSHAAAAMGLSAASGVDAQYSLSALLSRGKENFTKTPAHITFSRNLLVTLSDVVQFVNGIHHADEFPQFPAVLTITFAKNLAASCRAATLTLTQLQ
jgi:hypothetical protein